MSGLALLWRFKREALIGALVLLSVGLCHARDTSIAREAVVKAEAKRLRKANAELQTRMDSTQRHYDSTAKVTTRVTTEYREQRKAIDLPALNLPAPVVSLVLKADTLARACTTLVADGRLLIAQKDTAISNTRKAATADVEVANGSKVRTFLKAAGLVALGAVIHAAAHR